MKTLFSAVPVNFIRKFSLVSSFLATFAVPAIASVTVNSPANGAQVGSPFSLSATAANCSSQNVASMGYSLDSSTDTTVFSGTSVETSVASGTGAHTLHVKAWGNKGASCVTDVAITVGATASSSAIPSDAVSNGGLQTLSSWVGVNDSAAAGSSSGWTGLMNSPSRSGNARKFVSNYSNYGDLRFETSFGDDTTSTNFFYDAWIYLPYPSTSIANLEMDVNQVMPNGQTVIFGFQCDGWSGTWDYTTNKGTPQKPVDTWQHTSAGCNPRSWSTNTWHHVQISFSRDDSGNVTYKAVWLDGAESALNITAPSAFALGWAPTLLTNFQIDGSVSTSGTAAAYLDDLTIYRW
jgi:hypothetical protein